MTPVESNTSTKERRSEAAEEFSDGQMAHVMRVILLATKDMARASKNGQVGLPMKAALKTTSGKVMDDTRGIMVR